MSSLNPNSMQTAVDTRYRVILIIWLAMLASLGIYFLITNFVEAPPASDNGTIIWVLIALGVSTTSISFLLKRALLTRAAREQRLELVQVAYVIAFALCEMAGIFGVVAYFLTAHRYYHLLFIISALGILLHKPRRDDLLNAMQHRL